MTVQNMIEKPYSTTATASTIAEWDSNVNLSANNHLSAYTTTVTSASPVTLTVSSTFQQFFTGSTAQTLTMPVANTLVLGQSWYIVNNSSATLTIQSSGSNTILAMAGTTAATITCILASGTSAASWNFEYNTQSSGSGTVTSVATSGMATGGTITTTGTITVTAAVKSDQTTGTSTSVAVVPNVQQNHASAVKAWCRVSVSAGTYTLQDKYNVTSITKNSTGNVTVTLTTSFSDANYSVVTNGGPSVNVVTRADSAATGSFVCQMIGTNGSSPQTDSGFSAIACGPQ